MAKALKCGIMTPAIYHANPKESLLVMEFINGKTAKATIIEDEMSIRN
jgi:tRNA A-37 threonylcarbamoyl transferase component Bud32